MVNLQKSWIGNVNGVLFDWNVQATTSNLCGVSIPIWTDQPSNVLKVNFIAVTPGSMLDAMQVILSSDLYHIYRALPIKVLSFQCIIYRLTNL